LNSIKTVSGKTKNIFDTNILIYNLSLTLFSGFIKRNSCRSLGIICI